VRLLFAATAACLCVLASPAAAETYRATALEITSAAAEVRIIPEDRADIDVQIGPTGRLPTLTTRVSDGRLLIDGGLRNRIRGCSSWTGSGDNVRIAGIGTVRRGDLPRITVRVPRSLAYEAGGAIYSSIGASNGGSVTLNGCGDTSLGAANGPLDVDLNGSGGVRAERVSGMLAATLNGSGALHVVRADNDAALRLNGSGNLEVGDVAGRVDARLSGSGSLELGAAGGEARLVLNGSGNLRAGAIDGSLDADLNGSGNLRVAAVSGQNAVLDLSGSGNLSVDGGRVERLTARNSASGSVRFGGVAQYTRASLSASGDISIADAGRVEQLVDSGSGSVNLGR